MGNSFSTFLFYFYFNYGNNRITDGLKLMRMIEDIDDIRERTTKGNL